MTTDHNPGLPPLAAVAEVDASTDSSTARPIRTGFVGVVAGTIAALLVGLWLVRPILRAQFGPIDDHEPLSWLGRDNSLGWSEMWRTFFGHTEVGDFGAYGRFRPAYYASRV